MPYDLHDTIAAIATAAAGAARGVIRLSGPESFACVAQCFTPDNGFALHARERRRYSGTVAVTCPGRREPLSVPGHLFLWPDQRSYTRQPSAEWHMIGSPPLLAAALQEFCRHGARPAQPGEFTLRAFLAGRIDLIQAEGVLGIVDARTRGDLDDALDQLAGGLSRPLHALREDLLLVLAELEAGLDFADERIEFIERDVLRDRLAAGETAITATLGQLDLRERVDGAPRAVLVGLPNAGKSSLFNALVERYGEHAAARSIVSPTPGATRDYVSALIHLDGLSCLLVDSAGEEAATRAPLDAVVQNAAAAERRRAELQIDCVDATTAKDGASMPRESALHIITKSDLATSPSPERPLACSSKTGAGLDELACELRRRLASIQGEGAAAAATAARCIASLNEARRALVAAAELLPSGHDELLAAEIRAALDALGDVVGAVCADDVLDRVFSQFCIGK
jgi:tRNA modification GTPase